MMVCKHLALKRDFELVVIDAKRKFGNHRLLPSGPLRESINTISKKALSVYSGNDELDEFEYSVQFMPSCFKNVQSPELTLPLDEMTGKSFHAVAGIGDPQKFFNTLTKLNLTFQTHPFPDHHVFQQQDLLFDDSLAIVMTEKDAVKCKELELENAWYLEIYAQPNEKLKKSINQFIQTIQ